MEQVSTGGETTVAIDEQVAALPRTRVDRPVRRYASRLQTMLFAAAAFVGAGLLFVVQPLVARLLLPAYGGSATVWSTSSLFFQVLLLLAYGYSHYATRRLGRRWQPKVHLVVLLLPLAALPLAIPADASPSGDSSPVLWLLRTLLVVIGLPFAVVATTGPLLQRWYSWSDHARAEDPYFLFAASNLGSFGGLLAYPLLIEPRLTLAEQRAWWSIGFVVFVVLTGACALSVRGRAPLRETGGVTVAFAATRLTVREVLRWAGLAFVPSSLMLGVTSHISTDIAAIPLLWVVPLGIYLATFVVAFARTSRVVPRDLTRAAVALAFVLVVASVTPTGMPQLLLIALDLTVLALVAYAAHARLAAERPPAEHLTAFFLVIAGGGALGGLLNGFIAPVVLDRVLEYGLVLALVPLLVGRAGSTTTWLVAQWRANRVRASFVLVCGALTPLVLQVGFQLGSGDPAVIGTLFVAGLFVAAWLSQLPAVLVTGLLVMLCVDLVSNAGNVVERSRTFFGSYVVREVGDTHRLVHGTTAHGSQLRGSAEERRTPTTYYSRRGPLGDVFALGPRQKVAVVGLGAGTVAAYGEPGQEITFFEIDPDIVRIASDPALFSYVADSEAEVDMVVGDGRLALADTAPRSFDMIVLDAFSSDSIPVHLLTREAMQTYADRLAPGGVLMVHISNRVFELEPVLAGAADALGWEAALRHGNSGSQGATASEWVALDADGATVAPLREAHGWRELAPRRVRWTDDYSSILAVLR